MKIFISYSFKDADSYIELENRLSEQGHSVANASDFRNGNNFSKGKKETIRESDILIAIISQNFLASARAQAELGSVILGTKDKQVLLVVVGDVFVPYNLMGYQYIKVETKKEIAAAVLSNIAQLDSSDGNHTLLKKETITNSKENGIEGEITLLREALNNNQLTLVCGAGVSRDSHIPTWNELLVSILNEVFSNYCDSNAESKVDAEALLSLLPQSNLIWGKYLKMMLKEKFDKTVQKHLYLWHDFSDGGEPINPNLKTNMMKAIAVLSHPKRSGNRLESIITFNFDDLIECSLTNHDVEHCSIWKEGQTHEINELPIYHVHGFLPNKRDFEEPNLVFSEEAYHSQFIDPYSWSNIIQLNTFSTNVCLFVGISLSDPNLRRLLDISWRRNQRRKHYIIMKQSSQESRTDKIATMLFEQDANSLGLNVIWCSDFSEIPDILMKIAK